MGVRRRAFLKAAGGAVVLGGAGSATYGQVRSDGRASAPTALVAGSLLRAADRLGGAAVEAHGSVAVRRLVRDGMRSPDAVALADPRLFAGISDRATLFATNALVVAYHPESRYASALRRDWRAAIQHPGIRVGRTDPRTDPLGYRTVLALRLAAARGGVTPARVLDDSTIHPETGLLNALAGGALDAAFAYRNMAVQRDLPFVALPDAIDFSNPAFAETYRSVSMDIGDRVVRGAPIRYGAAALTAAGAPWVEDLVTARSMLREMGFVVPADYPVRGHRLA